MISSYGELWIEGKAAVNCANVPYSRGYAREVEQSEGNKKY